MIRESDRLVQSYRGCAPEPAEVHSPVLPEGREGTQRSDARSVSSITCPRLPRGNRPPRAIAPAALRFAIFPAHHPDCRVPSPGLATHPRVLLASRCPGPYPLLRSGSPNPIRFLARAYSTTFSHSHTFPMTFPLIHTCTLQ
jgi:hypothetical protein